MNPTKLILTDDQINEIAQDLDCGLRVFVHTQTGTSLSIPDFDDAYADPEFWEDVQQELDSNFQDYYEIERARSHDSFLFMADFADQLQDSRFKEELRRALDKRNPFREFKSKVEFSDRYRQEWFDFKNQRLKDWVSEKINELNQQSSDNE